MAAEEEPSSLQYSPTWVVAGVCFLIVFISLIVERGLHRLGKWLKHKKQDALLEALQKLKDELMLLGFISLLLTVFQGLVSQMCIPPYVVSSMLPCKRNNESKTHEEYSPQAIKNRRRLFSTESSSEHCSHEIRQWKHWERTFKDKKEDHTRHRHAFFAHAQGYWRKADVVSWTMSFFKQFYGSITKSDYIALREGFIMTHCPANREFDFHNYMMRTLELDFKKVVGISWYLWLFVVVFLLLNVEGWHTYFWLSFLPVVLLLLVGAKLEHIIILLAQDMGEMKERGEAARVRPSDEHFWLKNPGIVLHLIHFILFQNAFEIAFFFWILCTYGFKSCIMERMGYIIPRLIMGVMVQVLCSYITLPLYALVTQMGSKFKQGFFNEFVQERLGYWLDRTRGQEARQIDRMVKEPYQSIQIGEQETISTAGETRKSMMELSYVLHQSHEPST
ncbi:MLO-like protein 13 isoform X2 [Durio zibethinus]|uniref:MLO-like protein n=1 Tax=Durio zibethinus TaxID=66656 RepID=A0A6P5WJL8_DURZI|nr:MLO-like protein 13 isoform X2 [Durio zibethinus]